MTYITISFLRVSVVVSLIAMSLILCQCRRVLRLFQVCSITTTRLLGYGTTEMASFLSSSLMMGHRWFCWLLGLKVIRCLTYESQNQVLSDLVSNRVLTLHVNDTVAIGIRIHSIRSSSTFYNIVLSMIGLLFVVSSDNNNFMTVVKRCLSCFNNIDSMIEQVKPSPSSVLDFKTVPFSLSHDCRTAWNLSNDSTLLLPKTWSKRW